MSGNSIGRSFVLTSFGESHGPALGGIVDGCPPGMPLSEEDLQADLERRRTGKSRHTSQRRESDRVRILSGVFEGKTTGTAIGLLVENEDQRSRDYEDIKSLFRPGHADYTYQKKYGFRDYRGGGRASARETVIRVAAGAIARKFLASMGIEIRGWLAQLGSIPLAAEDLTGVDDNPFFCAEPGRVAELEAYMDRLRKSGDSVGARVNVMASGMPPGLGEPVFSKLDADIAGALMGINAAKGVEIGAGFRAVEQSGTEHRDPIYADGFRGNQAGGVLGGISSGQDILASVAFKPTSSLRIPVATIDIDGNPAEAVTKGRHDPCVGFRAVPIVEAMLALVLMDHYLRQRAQNADADSATPTVPAGTVDRSE